MSPFAAMWLCATVLSSSKASLNKSFPKSALRGHGFGGVWGAYASPRVVFGVSPKRVFRRDAGNCTDGDACAPQTLRRCQHFGTFLREPF